MIPTSLADLVRRQAATRPDAAALLAADRAPLSWAALERQVQDIGAALAGVGATPRDRVAIALPNGPEAATAFLGIAAHSGAAPLNPDMPQDEVVGLLGSIGPRALLVLEGADTPARAAAVASGVAVLELTPSGAAGACSIATSSAAARWPRSVRAAEAADVALLLHTSGTTSRPKLVPLTHTNLLSSASAVVETLRLEPSDRCLNLMPLFHVHGLVGALLASVTAGGSVVCTAGFRAGAVWDWIEHFSPTWYTAVPTIHRAFVDAARSHAARGTVPAAFRFARSSSSAMPPSLLAEVEDVFGCPLVEAYGMTEAAHQMASNPLPPGERRPGTVGRATGPTIAVVDEDDRPVLAGKTGEIVIRGPSVTSGYVDDPQATAAAFVDGWFHTGDLGTIDADGYVTIAGRIGDVINRGGEKIAPRQVDEALLAHPDVTAAVAFAVPHPRLGEDVAAAVVLRPGANVDESGLRSFVASRLVACKVPRRIAVVDAIPVGPTGKTARRGLAAALARERPASPDDGTGPRDEVDTRLVVLWQDVLGLDRPPGLDDDFFELGGDSLHAVELLDEIARRFDRHLPVTVLLGAATVRQMGDELRAPGGGSGATEVVALRPEGSRPPLFCLLRGGSAIVARNFVAAVGPDQPVYAVFVPTLHGRRDDDGSIETIAAEVITTIRTVRPNGPYRFFGHSLAGLVVYEAALQLANAGEHVGVVVLADTHHPSRSDLFWEPRPPSRVRRLLSRQGPAMVARRVRRRQRAAPAAAPHRPQYVPGTDVLADWDAVRRREEAYHPAPARRPVVVLSTENVRVLLGSPALGWEESLAAGCELHEVPGTHETMVADPHVHVLARTLVACLARADARESGADETGKA